MVTVLLKISSAPKRRREILQAIRPVLAPARVQPGCTSSLLCQDLENPNQLILVQEWNSQSELQNHFRSKDFKRILAAMEMADERPEMIFHIGGKTAGLEFVNSGGQSDEI